jgi:protein-tyrosine phosphatase
MKILMVCLGNICRSPLAEGILAHLAGERDLPWSVDSAGTGNWHVGEKPDGRSIAVARRYGIDISRQRARQFQALDFERFDRIFVMDTKNLRDVLQLASSPEQRAKVSLLLDELHPGDQRSVPDPYHDAEEGFEQVFQMLHQACTALLAKHPN